MTALEWFGVGAACAAALWWLRFLVRWLTFDGSPEFDPLHLHSEFRPAEDPKLLPGLCFGAVMFAFSPVWVPPYLVASAVIAGRNRSIADRRPIAPLRKAYIRSIGGPQ